MILVLCPLNAELDHLVAALQKHFGPPEYKTVDRFKLTVFQGLTLAVGGHGKVQFALTAAYLLERLKPKLLVCLGAAGALDSTLQIGDILAAVETVEHDFKLHFVKRPPPRFAGSPHALAILREVPSLRLGMIASGDEDVMSRERADQISNQTQALAVAWEGAGAARAAKFYHTEFIELRVITDRADSEARSSFCQSLEAGMSGLASVLLKLLDNVEL